MPPGTARFNSAPVSFQWNFIKYEISLISQKLVYFSKTSILYELSMVYYLLVISDYWLVTIK